MSKVVRRAAYERRARIRRAIVARRRLAAARYGIVVASFVVLAAAAISVYSIGKAFHLRGQTIQPLMSVNTSQTPRPFDPVAMTIEAPADETPSVADVTPPAAPPHAPPPAPLDQTIQPIDQSAAADVRLFNGRAVRAVGTVRMTVTAYSPDEKSCGRFADGVTAAGYSVFTNGGKLVAADTRILPFGSLLSIPGYDNENIVPVLDVGGKIKGYRLDVLFPDHKTARKWGVRKLDVTVYEFVD